MPLINPQSSTGGTTGPAGQSLYTTVVDAAGDGDFSTLEEALAAASAGDVIYIRAGTYTLTATNSTFLNNLTIIGESKETTIIDTGNYLLSFPGDRVRIYNVQIQTTAASGRISATGADLLIDGCVFIGSGLSTALWLDINSQRGRMTNCRIVDNGNSMSAANHMSFQGQNFRLSNSSFKTNQPSSTTYALINVGNNATIDGCEIDSYDGGSCYLFNMQENSSITNNKIYGSPFSSAARLAYIIGNYVGIRGNSIYGGRGTITTKDYLYDYAQVIDNKFYNLRDDELTILLNNYGLVAGNYIHRGGSNYAAIGCIISCTVTNNVIVNASVGVQANTGIMVVGNSFISCTTPVSVSGNDGNLVYGNVGVGDRTRTSYLNDGATITPNANMGEMQVVTLAGNRTMAAPTGTAQEGQHLRFRIKQDATGSRTITWNSIYRFSTTIPSPTLSTAASATDYVEFRYNYTDSKWDCTSVVLGTS